MSRFNKILSKIPVIKHKIGPETDNRSLQFIAVIDCILNQNVRDRGAAVYPAINRKVLELCQKYNVGIMQMPCPEIAFLGFNRNRPENMSIRDALDTPEGRDRCRQLSIDVVDRITELTRQDTRFLAVLGGNPESPGCAVHLGNGEQKQSSGVFIKELVSELDKRSLSIPVLPIRDFDKKVMMQDLQWLEQLFSNS